MVFRLYLIRERQRYRKKPQIKVVEPEILHKNDLGILYLFLMKLSLRKAIRCCKLRTCEEEGGLPGRAAAAAS